MLIDRFLYRFERADGERRAEIVRLLMEAYDRAPLTDADRDSAATLFSIILDDSSVRVRRALAEAMAEAADPPRHVAMALALDTPDVARPVLLASHLLAEDELVDVAALGGKGHRLTIAERARIGAGLTAALIEVADADVCLALVRNPGALLSRPAVMRLAERHGEARELREALLARRDLPPETRDLLVGRVADALSGFVIARGWMTEAKALRVAGEARDSASIALASKACDRSRDMLVEVLVRGGRLTPDFLLRALCLGRFDLFEDCLQRLSGLPRRRVAALLRDRRAVARQALLLRAGLSEGRTGAFQAVLSAYAEVGFIDHADMARSVRLTALERAVTQLAADRRSAAADPLVLMLMRLAAELRREASRDVARSARQAA